MIIKNFDSLVTTSLRRQALLIADAGLEAVDTPAIMRRRVNYNTKKDVLTVVDKKYDLKPFKRVVIIGIGKAALHAVKELHDMFGQRLSCGFVIDLVEGKMDNVVCKVGTHPFPTTVNVAATKELVGLLDGCAEEDLIIAVISGGGSSLLCYPVDMTCEEERNITKTLMKSGANISEINTVRKHISRVKGGQLAKICYPATVISLVFSDVPGDDLSLVASGPLVKDTTTMHEAMEIMHKYNVLDRCKLPSCSMVETPKEDKYFEKVTNVLICSSKDALMAMAEKAEDLGLKPRIWQTAFQGEARKLGPQIVQETKANECLLGAGESTVTVTGKGRGGRNQEMALAALEHLSANQVFVTVASDGYDNSEAAGALVDQGVLQQAKRLNLSIAEYLENNDSYIFFQETGSSLQTGLTGANVSDFFVSLRD